MLGPLSDGCTYRAARPVAALAVALAAASLGPPELPGQEPPPLVTDRPDQTESAAVVAPGFVQLELGWTTTRAEDDAARTRSHTAPEALARIGVLARLEARVGLPAWSSVRTEVDGAEARSEGLGDASLGLKLRLAEGRGATPSVALLGATTLPIGEEGLSSDRADPSFRVAASSQIAERLSLGGNVGVEWITESVSAPVDAGTVRDTQADFLYTLALGIALTERAGMFLESFGFAGVEASRPARHSLNGGLTFLVAGNLQLDARAGAGLDDDADDWFVGAGLAVRLPR